MKNFKVLLILMVLFLPLMVNAETCSPDKVTISSIALEDKSINASELNTATAKDKSINLDLNMLKVGDNVRYKMVIKNDSNEDYQMTTNSLTGSNYVEYKLESSDKSSVVKAKSSKTFYLTVNYKKEVPAAMFRNGTFKDDKVVPISLKTTNSKLVNPKTRNNLLFLLGIILLVGVSFIVFRKKKYIKALTLVLSLMLIPMGVYALCSCELKVDSKITISQPGLYVNGVKITNYSPEELIEEFNNMVENYMINSNRDINYGENYWTNNVFKYTESNNEDVIDFIIEATSENSANVSFDLANGLSIHLVLVLETDYEEPAVCTGYLNCPWNSYLSEYKYLALNGNRLNNPTVIYNGSSLNKNFEDMLAEALEDKDPEYVERLIGEANNALFQTPWGH